MHDEISKTTNRRMSIEMNEWKWRTTKDEAKKGLFMSIKSKSHKRHEFTPSSK